MKNKKIIVAIGVILFFMIMILFLVFINILTPNVYIDYKKSFFNSYNVKNDSVNIKCELVVVNEFQELKRVRFSAIDNDDVLTGLLKNNYLAGFDSTGLCSYFLLKPGENRINILFVGEYAGNNIKANRKLPQKINISLFEK